MRRGPTDDAHSASEAAPQIGSSSDNAANRTPTLTLDDYVEKFETMWLSHRVSLRDFVAQHPVDSAETLVELIRSDMEFQWKDGNATTLTDYEAQFPQLAHDSSGRSLIAYEEFRQRRQKGEEVSPLQLQELHAIDLAWWPAVPKSEASTDSPPSSHPVPSSGSPKTGRSSSSRIQNRELKPGATWSDFTIVGALGEGAHGSVYLATQGELAHRFVVLKISSNDTKEPQLLAELQHTNIMPILSLHRYAGALGICMPFLGAVTLRDFQRFAREHQGSTAFDQACLETVLSRKSEEIGELLRHRSKRFVPETLDAPAKTNLLLDVAKQGKVSAVLWLIQQIAEGLSHAHHRGIVHGDLKPANILISDDGHPLLLDFHLSQWRSREGFVPEGGTLPYMSPEHLRAMVGNQPIDHRTDLYSLGVILYELLADRSPFPLPATSSKIEFAEIAKQREQLPPRLASTGVGFDRDLDAIIQKCLAPRVEDRYQSCEELLADLTSHQLFLPLQFARKDSVLQRARKWWKRNGRVATSSGVVAAIVLACLLLTAFLVQRTTELRSIETSLAADSIQSEIRSLIEPLTVLDQSPIDLQQSLTRADELLAERNAMSLKTWTEAVQADGFDAEQQLEERELIAQLYFWMAHAQHLAKHEESSYTSDDAARWNRLAQQFTVDASMSQAIALQAHDLGTSSETPEWSIDGLNPTSLKSSAICLMFGTALQTSERSNDQSVEESTEKLLLRATEIEPQNFLTWLMLGNQYVGQGELDRAIASYSVSIALAPQNTRGYYHRGLAAFEKKDFAQAQADFRWIVDHASNGPEQEQIVARFNLVATLFELQNYEQAREEMDWILEHATEASPQFLLTSAKIFARLGDRDKAQAELLTAANATPRSLQEWLAQGLCFYQLNQVEQAIQAFEQASRRYPESVEPYQNLAHLWSEKKQDAQRAIGYMDSVIDLVKSRPDQLAQALAVRAVLYARSSKSEEANADLAKALELSSDAEMLVQASCVHTVLGTTTSSPSSVSPSPDHVERAIQYLAQAAWLDSELVRRRLDSDPDLAPLRFEEKFQAFENTLLLLESYGKESLEPDAFPSR